MNVESVESVSFVRVVIDGTTYERYSPTSWYEWMGESLENLYDDCADLERAYQQHTNQEPNKGGRNKMHSKKVSAFLHEVIALYRKHGLSISHEDGHGGFIIENYSTHNCDWLMAADDETKQEPEWYE